MSHAPFQFDDMPWWFQSIANQEPYPHSSRVYVSQDIYQYCQKSGKDVLAYCKTIEPHTPSVVTEIIPYDNNNPHHVSDVLNGCLVIRGSYEELYSDIDKKATIKVFGANKDGNREANMQEAAIFIKAIQSNDEKEETKKVLSNIGIQYGNYRDLFDDEDDREEKALWQRIRIL